MVVDEDDLRSVVIGRRQLRSDLLIALYVATKATPAPLGRARLGELSTDNEWDANEVMRTAQFLKGTGHIEFVSTGDLVGITPLGIDAVERSLVPDEDVLQPLDAIELRAIERFVRDLRGAVESDSISAQPADLEEIRTMLETIERHLVGRPRRRILRAVLQVTSSLLLGIGGNLATDLARRIPTLL